MPANVLALSAVSLLNDASSEAIYPLLPFFLSLTLGASPFAVGMIEGAAESMSSLLKLFSGYLSDKFARHKLPVLTGYGISAVMRPFLGFATGWTQVLFLRLIDRAGKGIRSAPRDALIAESIAPEKRGLAFGFHRAMDNAGAVLGPLLAFVLIYFIADDRSKPNADDYSKVFLFASIPALLALIVIAFFVTDAAAKARTSNAAIQLFEDESASKVEFGSEFKKFLGVLILFTLSNSADAFLLLRASETGIAPVYIPLLWMMLNLVKVFSSLVGGDLSDRIGRKKLIFAGWVLYSLVYLGFAFVTSATQVWVLFLIYGCYFGLTEGAEKALIADLSPPNRRGTAFGWYHLAFGIAVFPASLLTGALWKFYGAQTAFLVCAAISLTAAFSLFGIKTRKTI